MISGSDIDDNGGVDEDDKGGGVVVSVVVTYTYNTLPDPQIMY